MCIDIKASKFWALDQRFTQQGLNPNDPSDAEADFDSDGLLNLQEYTYSTDPNNADTDGDGATDKKEIDKGTDPLDPSSKPKGILGTIFLVLIIALLLGGLAYGAYYYYQNYLNKPKPAEKPAILQRMISRPMPGKPAQKPIAKKPKPEEIFIP